MIKVYKDKIEASEAMAEDLKTIALNSVKENGRFTIALTGGSSPIPLYNLLKEKPLVDEIPWDKTYIFWGDERCVPFDHEDNNAKMAWDTFLDFIPIPLDHVYRMNSEVHPRQGAEEYEKELKNHFKDSDPVFDLILLGMGADGHTASIFPGSGVIHEKEKWVDRGYNMELNSDRITLTAPLINQAKNIFFGVYGEGKAETLKNVIEGEYNPLELPSQLIKPDHGNLVWYTDEAAAALLESK
ncbi:6-phosphogluconolactonase [Fulvivirga ligni]|uniref:6-phosphogluconolactonase n=1 Tax=Fulvivirga ligni TaxID=2904246 RepID=UPI001F197DFB|nr:6-phosphogluconolactonase [Fulvivirga ligni]UII20764.1 6-phosphogluconolactonase [Fulvivirga ligni]